MDSAARESGELFGDYGPAVTCAAALILVLAIAVIDRLTGYDLRLGVLNIVPIAMVAWTAGRTAGIALVALTVAIWMMVFRGALATRAPMYYYWDAALLFGTLLAFVLIIARLRESARGQEIAFLDALSAPAYVVDAAGEILYRNPAFRDVLAARSMEELARYPAIEAEIRWPGRGRSKLRILTV
jgi:PAS domain-containing protein